MKKLLLVAMVAFGLTANAQDKKSSGQTAEGKWLIEANTAFGGAHAANTSFQLSSVSPKGGDSVTAWNLGLEGGYFVMDDLAIKAGLGYGDSGREGVDGVFSYKIGAKYYINSMIPVQIDYSGTDIKDGPSYLGLQGGYAIFLGENVSIEPGLKYHFDLSDAEANIFQFNVGFALHF